MATSEHWQISRVVSAMMRENPASVLDVGCGWGKFGVLTREYTSATRVDALDAIDPRYPVYDHAYRGDLRELGKLIPPGTPRYDLAIFIEVIEHLEKEDAYAVLRELLRVARKVLVTTPWGFRVQEIEGMPYETHRSGWYPWDFRRVGRVERVQVYPAHFTRHLHLPRHWQQLVLVSAKAEG